MILPVALVSMAAAAYIGYASAANALTKEAFNQVTAVRNSKKYQLEVYFRTLRDTFAIFGGDAGMAAAAKSLIDGFDQLDGKIAPEQAKALEDFYRNTFIPALSKSPGFEETTVAEVLPRDGRAVEVQSLFIVDNPYKLPDRDKFGDSPVANSYTAAHSANHVWLKGVADKLKLDDLFIVSDKGQIVYSTEKQVEFGTSLLDGPYANSGLGHLFRDIIEKQRNGLVKLTDYTFYMPANGAPAMFIGTPIYHDYKLVGVLVGQVSTDEVNRTLNGGRSWRADGLGDTGFVYVVGPAQYLRNDHRIFIEHPEQFFDAATSQGYKPAELDAMRRDQTTIMRYRMNTEGVRRALEGQAGTVTAPNSLGHYSMQAYTPLDIPDLNWVLNANIERQEILAPLDRLKQTMMIVACVLTLLCTLLAIWMAARFVRPINALMRGIDEIKRGKADVQVARVANDEFGKLAGSFNAMATAIKDRDETIEAKNKAYGALLHRVFPQVVADRMRRGEEEIVDTLANVTLIYIDTIGFLRATERMAGDESLKLLNDMVDRFDNLAEKLGIEPVKSIGEHYIAACGLTVPRLDHAVRVVEFADAVAAELKLIGTERGVELAIRASVESGVVHAGLVGNSRFVYDVWGRPLSIVRQLIQDTPVNEIRITDEVRRQLGEGNGFEPRPASRTLSEEDILCFGRAPKSVKRTDLGDADAARQLADA